MIAIFYKSEFMVIEILRKKQLSNNFLSVYTVIITDKVPILLKLITYNYIALLS